MNRSVVLFAIAGIIIETLAILSFICIAKTEFVIFGKQLVATIFLVFMSIFLAILVRLFPIKPLIISGAIFAIGSGIIIQMLGFYFFPGLVKDVVLISFDNLWRFGIVVALHFCCYMIGVFVMIILRNIIVNKTVFNIKK